MRNSSRTWLRRANASFAADILPGALVLDAGAGEQPYKNLLAHCRYEAADFEKIEKPYAKSTYVCDLGSIPVEDNRFDAILFNQVMEHLSAPATVLRELYRVLKPGGRMICSAPLVYEEHEAPHDYFRYTQFAWRHLMRDAGFRIEKLEWLEGYFGTMAYQLEAAYKYMPVRPKNIAPGLVGWLSFPVVATARLFFFALAGLFHRLDERNKVTDRGFPKNYIAIVTKPAAA